ncbi:HFL088Wp [Eremothecium sinecaudum]|uniref:histone acetyltransferase n=1 Tax=Eremothecium sinecaudum TaxID=45286 RepID=A0A120K2J6_9SACH|nr:HFL088Wp [Eremothecium sinecaudum]AMD21768.1 HFL088Wp [Eremothecium sinecaudum]
MRSSSASDNNELYGILEKRNINEVQFGIEKRFKTWYGNAVYFANDRKTLGYKSKSTSMTEKGNEIKTEEGQYWLDLLYVCEYCFKYYDDGDELLTHEKICIYKSKAPGRIKYASPEYTIRRVKGTKHELLCQCMCLFTKLFLDNKSVYFKLTSYEFYIVYQNKSTKPLGFFSKDLYSYHKNNLACILVFPPYQKMGLGTLLIEFSYRLSKHEGLISGPELPLSPFGLIGYLKYWSFAILWCLTEGELSGVAKVSIENLCEVTGIRVADVIMTLKHLKCLTNDNEILLPAVRKKAKNYKVERGFMIQDRYLLIDD